jgi:hypothetical protein
VWLVSTEAEDDGEHGGEARVVLNLELESRFENFDPKSKPNLADDPWEVCGDKKQINCLRRGG